MSFPKYRILVMNNPFVPLERELQYISNWPVDAIELTVETPEAYLDKIPSVKKILSGRLAAGHTRDDLPLASPDKAERLAAVNELLKSIELLAELGVPLVTVHPNRGIKGQSNETVFELNCESLLLLAERARTAGIRLLVENQPPFPSAGEMSALVDALGGRVGLTLDLAHAYCYGGQANVTAFIETLAHKVEHIHISDNNGSTDEHLFPTFGTFDFVSNVPLLLNRIAASRAPRELCITLESFRLSVGGHLKMIEVDERDQMVSDAVHYIKKLLPGDV